MFPLFYIPANYNQSLFLFVFHLNGPQKQKSAPIRFHSIVTPFLHLCILCFHKVLAIVHSIELHFIGKWDKSYCQCITILETNRIFTLGRKIYKFQLKTFHFFPSFSFVLHPVFLLCCAAGKPKRFVCCIQYLVGKRPKEQKNNTIV